MISAPIHLYDLSPPQQPRWFAGDQYPRALVRAAARFWRGTPPVGLGKVTRNLGLGLDRIGQPYRLHSSPVPPGGDGVVGIIHGPIESARKIAVACRSVTGPGILDFPQQWPALFSETKAAFHLQNCEWAAAYYRPFFGNRVRVWAMGVDTDTYAPRPDIAKDVDFLVYNKLRWPGEHPEPGVREHCLRELDARGLRWREIVYGRYPRGRESSYHAQVARSRAMLFLCENETQGFAYNEALSMGVPMLAWNPGLWLDPNRHARGLSDCPASSVPYWDERCGEQFRRLGEFGGALDCFLERLRAGAYHPRNYILENLTLEQGARRYVQFLAEATLA